MDFNRSVLVWDYFCINRNPDSILDAPRQMIPLTYILLVLIHAYYDSTEIKKGIIIDHFRESIYYLFAFMLLGVAFKLTLGGEVLPLILFPLLARAAFFDMLLN